MRGVRCKSAWTMDADVGRSVISVAATLPCLCGRQRSSGAVYPDCTGSVTQDNVWGCTTPRPRSTCQGKNLWISELGENQYVLQRILSCEEYRMRSARCAQSAPVLHLRPRKNCYRWHSLSERFQAECSEAGVQSACSREESHLQGGHGRGSLDHCRRWVPLAVWMQPLALPLMLHCKHLESILAKVLISTMENYYNLEKSY